MEVKILSTIIDEFIHNDNDAPRDYIGASSIGEPCLRKLYYQYTGVKGEPLSNKQLRTLTIGKRLESMLLDLLEDAELDIERPQDYNDNLAVSDKEVPNFKGHLDGLWITIDKVSVLEIKTARDSSFRIFSKNGLMKWQPVYYAQVQSYMGMTGLDQAYVIALNKDTSEIHDEKVDFDPSYYGMLKTKASHIINMEKEPTKINESPLFYMCRLCKFRNVCHK